MRHELEVYRGASTPFNIRLKIKGGGAYTLGSGEKIIFGVKEKPEDEELLIVKTITEAPGGVAVLNLIPDDTIGLKFGRYCYDVGLQSGEKYIPVIKISPFVVLPNVTKWGDGS